MAAASRSRASARADAALIQASAEEAATATTPRALPGDDPAAAAATEGQQRCGPSRREMRLPSVARRRRTGDGERRFIGRGREVAVGEEVAAVVARVGVGGERVGGEVTSRGVRVS
jgi:hypothetical protein